MNTTTEPFTPAFYAEDTYWWNMDNATSFNVTFVTVLTPEYFGDYEFSQMSKIVLAIIISIVTIMGIFSNIMVILVVICYSDMHTVFNFSFANLALADLALLLLDAVPRAADTVGLNLTGKLGCAVPIYLQHVAAQVTSLTLAFLSWDRYRLIVKPLESRLTRTSQQIYLNILLIWIASFVCQIPTAYVSSVLPETGCNEFGLPWGQQLFFTYSTVTTYIIPLLVIVPCYTSIARNMTNIRNLPQRRKSITWILFIVGFFLVMWLPVHVVHIWQAFHPHITPHTPMYVELHTAANVLIYLNSSVNPFLYPLAVPAFRKHLKRIVYRTCCGALLRKPKAPRATVERVSLTCTAYL